MSFVKVGTGCAAAGTEAAIVASHANANARDPSTALVCSPVRGGVHTWTSIALLSRRKPAPARPHLQSPAVEATHAPDAADARVLMALAIFAVAMRRAARARAADPARAVLLGADGRLARLRPVGAAHRRRRLARAGGVLPGAALPVFARRHLRDRRAPPAARPHRADRHRVGVVRAARRRRRAPVLARASLPPAAVRGSSPG